MVSNSIVADKLEVHPRRSNARVKSFAIIILFCLFLLEYGDAKLDENGARDVK
jgi:hypothetical protein